MEKKLNSGYKRKKIKKNLKKTRTRNKTKRKLVSKKIYYKKRKKSKKRIKNSKKNKKKRTLVKKKKTRRKKNLKFKKIRMKKLKKSRRKNIMHSGGGGGKMLTHRKKSRVEPYRKNARGKSNPYSKQEPVSVEQRNDRLGNGRVLREPARRVVGAAEYCDTLEYPAGYKRPKLRRPKLRKLTSKKKPEGVDQFIRVTPEQQVDNDAQKLFNYLSSNINNDSLATISIIKPNGELFYRMSDSRYTTRIHGKNESNVRYVADLLCDHFFRGNNFQYLPSIQLMDLKIEKVSLEIKCHGSFNATYLNDINFHQELYSTDFNEFKEKVKKFREQYSENWDIMKDLLDYCTLKSKMKTLGTLRAPSAMTQIKTILEEEDKECSLLNRNATIQEVNIEHKLLKLIQLDSLLFSTLKECFVNKVTYSEYETLLNEITSKSEWIKQQLSNLESFFLHYTNPPQGIPRQNAQKSEGWLRATYLLKKMFEEKYTRYIKGGGNVDSPIGEQIGILPMVELHKFTKNDSLQLFQDKYTFITIIITLKDNKRILVAIDSNLMYSENSIYIAKLLKKCLSTPDYRNGPKNHDIPSRVQYLLYYLYDRLNDDVVISDREATEKSVNTQEIKKINVRVSCCYKPKFAENRKAYLAEIASSKTLDKNKRLQYINTISKIDENLNNYAKTYFDSFNNMIKINGFLNLTKKK